ncbi:hypothetical protein HPP92_022979 [Vanilla planifolia]|uniref:Uncharacterized protein n=1 Tax=Vanilla planifolia TaxID=51239 RepID=A0A835UHR3_VANPL|nr:hypothetical protein HPP92_023244 [Vanilla planifolia]KAG0459851.1 hypothetical protein HPP92_022979 [Vanilla planifolia]
MPVGRAGTLRPRPATLRAVHRRVYSHLYERQTPPNPPPPSVVHPTALSALDEPTPTACWLILPRIGGPRLTRDGQTTVRGNASNRGVPANTH